MILPGAIPDAGFRLLEFEEASSTLCKHSCRVGIQFDRVSEHFDGFSPFSLKIFFMKTLDFTSDVDPELNQQFFFVENFIFKSKT